MLLDGHEVFLVLLLLCYSANCQYTLTGPSSAAQGSTVTFTCTTSPVQTGLLTWRWLKSGSNTDYTSFYNSVQGQCQGTPEHEGYIFDCNSTSGVFKLSFTVDFSRHSGSIWKCIDGQGGTGESNNIALSVTVPLTSLTLLNATSSPLTVAQDTDVTLVCETNPTDPESTISLRRDGQSVSQGVTSSTRQETGGVVTVSVWSQRVQWTDRGTYNCEALNSGVTRTSQNLTLNVQVGVSSVTLTNITNNNQQVPVNQDSSLVLTCQTSPAYPAPTVTWYVNSIMTSSGVTSRTESQTSGQMVTVSTMTRTMRKNNDQDTFYCRAENVIGVTETQSNTARANVFCGPDSGNSGTHSESSRTVSLGTGLGIGFGTCLPIIAVLLVVAAVLYRKLNTEKNQRQDQVQTNRAFRDIGPTIPDARPSTYDGLDNTTRSQDYTELTLYETPNT